jgi:hypothetical protein
MDPCIEAINWPNSEDNGGTVSFRTDTDEDFSFRRDYGAPGYSQLCKTDTIQVPVGTGQFTETTVTYNTQGYPAPESVQWATTFSNAAAMKGTFAGSFNLIVGISASGSYILQSATVGGTWQASPLPAPFPKCYTSEPNDYAQYSDGAVDLICDSNGSGLGGGTCAQPFLDLSSPAPPGEWQGIP